MGSISSKRLTMMMVMIAILLVLAPVISGLFHRQLEIDLLEAIKLGNNSNDGEMGGLHCLVDEGSRSSHDPIRIDSDADFDAAHGVVSGTGEASDQYILAGLEIDGTGLGYCIYIGNTTKHFTVRDCVLHDANGGPYVFPFITGSGLTLYNVHNGTVMNITVTSSIYAGIFLHTSEMDYITDNILSNNTREIFIRSSTNCMISRNNVSSGTDGASPGIYLYYTDNCLIEENDASNTTFTGLRLDYSNNNIINRNTMTNNNKGLWISGGSNNTVTENRISLNSNIGIHLHSSSDTTIIENLVSNNADVGIYLDNSDDCSLENNTIIENFWYGISISSSSGNIIHANNLTSNRGATSVHDPLHVQAYDLSTNNAWWLPAPQGGNRWGDWLLPDDDLDGFVDSVYLIDGGGAVDALPLTNESVVIISELAGMFACVYVLAVASFVLLIRSRLVKND